MSKTSSTRPEEKSRARWIAAGFIVAFATSIFTVIYTGLNVEATRADFDAGFRSVTLAPGEQRTVELVFESDAAYAQATLEVTLPAVAEFAIPGEYSEARKSVVLTAGENRFDLDIRALAAGSGYIIARIEAREPIGLDRVFLTVSDE